MKRGIISKVVLGGKKFSREEGAKVEYRCPLCCGTHVAVYDSRVHEAQDQTTVIRRRRRCGDCGETFKTVELTELQLSEASTGSKMMDRNLVVSALRGLADRLDRAEGGQP